MNDLDTLISDALHARADQLTATDLSPALAPTGDVARRPSWAVPLLAAAAVAAVAVGSTVVIRSVTASPSHPTPAGSRPAATSSASPTSTAPTSSTSPSGSPTSTNSGGPTSGPSETGSPVLTGPPGDYNLGYQPLWPFTNYAQANSWQVHRARGYQPWHADAGQTALLFTRNYLGFTDITTVTSSRTDAQGAHIGVGYRNPAGALATAAVLHLVRYGPNPEAPWEVVGSDDTSLSLEQPAYGATVSSPIAAGGHVTGVDESIRLAVRNQAGVLVGGPAQPIPAGGQDQPWHGTVNFTGSGVLTIVASTGGHLQAVERFAIQGVHT
jgi:hypothetical protein